MIIFALKMTVKSGLDFLNIQIEKAPSEILANLPGQFSLLPFCADLFALGSTATLKELVEFSK